MVRYSPARRATVAGGVALREVSDYSRGLIASTGATRGPGDRITEARNLLILAARALDMAVVQEALSGATWEQIAEARGLSADECRARYEATVVQWANPSLPAVEAIFGDLTLELSYDADPGLTAETLDDWLTRHAEPWELDAGPTPVQDATRP